jgi:DNA-directed RNA polymerase sigma subunit (sigma70/sigma32)
MDRFSATDSIYAEAASLSAYLRDIGGNRILSRQEERALYDRICMGDAVAVQELIAANLKIVVSICRGFSNRGLPLSDLICEGNLALTRAARSFDASQGCRFAAYAAWWIRRRVLRALTKQARYLAARTARPADGSE